MTENNKKKQFDCIAMKSSIQDQIYNETKKMTVNELLNYYNNNDKGTEVPVGKIKNVALNMPTQS